MIEHLEYHLVIGLHPTVLLPPHWEEWTDDQLQCVLYHELAHVARGD
jgi:beta-lactamase regulating signal transducer with metallopeptidase domain